MSTLTSLTSLTALQLALVAAIVFSAYVVRGASGFGAGLVATPLLALMMPLARVVPLTALLVFMLFIVLTVRDRHEVHWPEFWLLLWPTLLGVVCGALVFAKVGNSGLTFGLGCFLVSYALYMLVTNVMGVPQFKFSTRWAFPLAFIGAAADTVFGGGGGTLVVIYIHGRGVSKEQFRATLAVLWFLEMIARIAGYALAGYYTRETLILVAAMLPFLAVGTWVGERINARISQKTFSIVLALVLMGSGVSLLIK